MENDYSKDKPVTHITADISSDVINRVVSEFRSKKKLNVTFGDIVLYAIAKALSQFPNFNSNHAKELKLYPSINIGYFINIGDVSSIAVISDADKKSITEISACIKESVMDKIRKENKIKEKDATILVTNLSPFKSYQVVPPLYADQSATISICSEHDSCMISEGKIISEKRFNLTLSYDSRIADCQLAINFTNKIKSILEKEIETI